MGWEHALISVLNCILRRRMTTRHLSVEVLASDPGSQLTRGRMLLQAKCDECTGGGKVPGWCSVFVEVGFMHEWSK